MEIVNSRDVETLQNFDPRQPIMYSHVQTVHWLGPYHVFTRNWILCKHQVVIICCCWRSPMAVWTLKLTTGIHNIFLKFGSKQTRKILLTLMTLGFEGKMSTKNITWASGIFNQLYNLQISPTMKSIGSTTGELVPNLHTELLAGFNPLRSHIPI